MTFQLSRIETYGGCIFGPLSFLLRQYVHNSANKTNPPTTPPTIPPIVPPLRPLFVEDEETLPVRAEANEAEEDEVDEDEDDDEDVDEIADETDEAIEDDVEAVAELVETAEDEAAAADDDEATAEDAAAALDAEMDDVVAAADDLVDTVEVTAETGVVAAEVARAASSDAELRVAAAEEGMLDPEARVKLNLVAGSASMQSSRFRYPQILSSSTFLGVEVMKVGKGYKGDVMEEYIKSIATVGYTMLSVLADPTGCTTVIGDAMNRDKAYRANVDSIE